jgi:hypothetical protein
MRVRMQRLGRQSGLTCTSISPDFQSTTRLLRETKKSRVCLDWNRIFLEIRLVIATLSACTFSLRCGLLVVLEELEQVRLIHHPSLS